MTLNINPENMQLERPIATRKESDCAPKLKSDVLPTDQL